MRRHYPICECVPMAKLEWFSEDYRDQGYFNHGGIYDSYCQKCLRFFWWELANDESMQALAEMNAQ